MNVRLPNFLIAGVPKSGTTALHQHLSEHPDVFLPAKKELHYFSYPYLTRDVTGPGDKARIAGLCRTMDEYQAQFVGVGDQKAVGEASPSYFFFPQCIAEMKRTLGDDLRVIVMLRNPARRAFSNHQHLVNNGRETLGFQEALAAESERTRQGWGDFWRYRQHSLYAGHLAAYREAFPGDQLKVIIFEEMTANTLGAVQDIYRYLGVDGAFVPPGIDIVVGRGGRTKNISLRRMLRGTSVVATRAKGLIPSAIYHDLRRFKNRLKDNNKVRDTGSLDDATYRELMASFEDDIRKTEQLLERNLDVWRNK